LAPSTVNRLMNDFRAALRAETKMQTHELRTALPLVIADGLQTVPGSTAARCALLSDADTRAVIDAAFGVDPDLGALALVLASTGARFSQVAALRVCDVQANAQRIMVPASGKGKANKARAVIAVPVGEDVIQRLAPLMSGRAGHEPLLLRWVHRQVAPTKWEAVARAPWSSAAHMQRGWKKALAAAGVAYVEPYALRHSSIVRGLRVGVPVRIVASLHDTSTAMIERHYSAYILDAADELARRALVPLTTPAPALLIAV
jgi:integrase